MRSRAASLPRPRPQSAGSPMTMPSSALWLRGSMWWRPQAPTSRSSSRRATPNMMFSAEAAPSAMRCSCAESERGRYWRVPRLTSARANQAATWGASLRSMARRYSFSPTRNADMGTSGNVLAGQVVDAAFAHVEVVLDAHAAERPQLVHPAPVDGCGILPQRIQQHVDEVDARLDGEHLIGRDGGGVAEKRVLRLGLDLRATDVVAGQPQRVAQSMRKEG